MKIKGIISKTFMLLAIIMFSFVFSNNVNAANKHEMDGNIEEVSFSPANDKINIKFKYTKGVGKIVVYVYSAGTSAQDEPTGNGAIISYSQEVEDTYMNINKYESVAIQEVTITDPTGIKNLNPEKQYKVVVVTKYCLVRNDTNNDCVAVGDLVATRSAPFYPKEGITSDATINNTLIRVMTMINDVGLPIAWGLLGILLLVRGMVLGMAIVKSSDDEQERKRKINGIVYLFIGVAVAYGISIAASYYMSTLGWGGIFK